MRGGRCTHDADGVCSSSSVHNSETPAVECDGTSKGVGLNSLYRGGKGGASAARDRRRLQKAETFLLEGLKELLGKVSNVEPRQQEEPHAHESQMIAALYRIIKRAEKNPGSLVVRLKGLIGAVEGGHFASAPAPSSQGPKGLKGEGKGSGVKGEASGKGKSSDGLWSSKGSGAPKGKGGKGLSKGKGTEALLQQAPGPPQGSVFQREVRLDNKTKGPGPTRKTSDSTAKVQMYLPAWPANAVIAVDKLTGLLEKGKPPSEAAACLCGSVAQAENLRRLAKLQQCSDGKFALVVVAKKQAKLPDEAKAVLMPMWESGQLVLRDVWLFPLGMHLPACVPTQAVKTTKVAASDQGLAIFRVLVPKSLVAKDEWEGIRGNPRLSLKAWEGPLIHSTYGWKILSDKGKDGSEELVLEGFLRVKEASVGTFSERSGQGGVFLQRLVSPDAVSDNVWWLPRSDKESLVQYFLRAQKESGGKHPFAYRKGGGSSIGLRHLNKPQPRAWRLSGAPKGWTEADIISCLTDIGCTEVSILGLPRQRLPWLVRAIGPDGNIGVIPITTEDAASTMLLSQVASGSARTTSEVERLGRGTRKADKPSPVEKEAPSTPNARDSRSKSPHGEPAATQHDDPTQDAEMQEGDGNGSARARERSRTPKKPKDSPDALSQAVTLHECGGDGRCGYQAIAAGMSFRAKKSWESFKDNLVAMGRTCRHDIYCHLKGHSAEYEPMFLPDERTTELHEDGPVPKSWPQYLEGTLRDKRWIDGINIAAAARRYGVSIVVASLEKQFPPVRFGKASKDPLVLVHTKEHYVLATLNEGFEWPADWVGAEQHSASSQVPRAGGRKSSSSSNGSWRPQGTPRSSADSQPGSPLPVREPNSSSWERPVAVEASCHA